MKFSPLVYVSIVVKNDADEVITGGITDEKGQFNIKGIPEGKSNVSIQYIGYKSYTSFVEIRRGKRKVYLGTIQLEEDIEALDEVVVRAETSTMEGR